MSLSGAYISNVAVRFKNEESIGEIAKNLIMGFGNLDIYAAFKGKLLWYHKGVGYSAQGWQFFMIPFGIMAFTIFNMVLGAVSERTKEIAIFSSVGLSPLHVSGMFIAEFFVYAIISSILGYMAGITVQKFLIEFHLLPEGFHPNLASTFIVAAVSLSIAGVMASSLYPLLKAAKMVTPSLERKWRITTKPVGDEWDIPLPFRAEEHEIPAILEFMREYFAVGTTKGVYKFETRKLDISFKERTLKVEVALEPYEAGVTQSVNLKAQRGEGEKSYYFIVNIRYLTGLREVWERNNYAFVDNVRKQLLLWKRLGPKERQIYIKRTQGVKS